MLKDGIAELFERDLLKLRQEIELYNDEASLWVIGGDTKNSAGTLVLHIVGNLNHFLGAVLGKTGYIRNRDAEFSTRKVPQAKLIALINETIDVVKLSLSAISEEELEKEYPAHVSSTGSTAVFLVSLLAHVNYHLGQVNYHRRLLS